MSLSSARALTATVLAACAAGCSPALDWREVRPPGTPLLLLFPCKPQGQDRLVALAGTSTRLALQACPAAGQTWGLAVADVGDPARVGPALAGLAAAAAANIGAAAATPTPVQVRGATPNPGSQRWALQGRMPDGKGVVMQVVVFTHGTQVFQATVLGPQAPPEAADSFFDSMRIQP